MFETVPQFCNVTKLPFNLARLFDASPFPKHWGSKGNHDCWCNCDLLVIVLRWRSHRNMSSCP